MLNVFEYSFVRSVLVYVCYSVPKNDEGRKHPAPNRATLHRVQFYDVVILLFYLLASLPPSRILYFARIPNTFYGYLPCFFLLFSFFFCSNPSIHKQMLSKQ